MFDFEQLKKIFGNEQNLMDADVQDLFQSATTKSYPLGTYLIQMDDLKKDIFFIKKGIVRLFKINDKGEEITIDIRWENQFIASRDVLLFNKPSTFFCKTIEPTEVLHINYETLIARDPKLEALVKFVYQILEQPLTRLDSFLLRTPEERYMDYVKSYPDILNRIPDKYLANVLGITPVSLSRIRKRIASKK